MSALAPASLGQAPQPADATGLLYERYAGRIFGYCFSLLGSREDAEDAVQTTFVNAQRGLHRGVVPQFELAWLFKIARNVCHNSRESSSRRGRVEATRDLDALQDVLTTPERGGAVSIGELTSALSGIPERQRRALLLREFQGLSYAEIAAELGVSVAAVETLIFRARRSVAEQLSQAGTTRRRGAVASLVALFRWFVKGGAAPLKVAAATAIVATTATLAVSPAVRDHRGAPVPASPRLGTFRADRPTATPRRVVRQRSSARPAAVRTSAPAVEPSSATAPPARNDGQTTSIAPAPRESGASVSSPSVTVPSVTVPSVTVPTLKTPVVTVPETALPQADLPAVELPIETPKLPDLPQLP